MRFEEAFIFARQGYQLARISCNWYFCLLNNNKEIRFYDIDGKEFEGELSETDILANDWMVL